ncbi:MAG: bifunctional DNA-formamidopyrimidine glycosylase/DNA-(apurinic or apyrimidinic site) lyase [Gammaproteobacteria bacterium]|nr:MAG: bifunctional DNA-formamidopyrimidine glycosylase/DNA-(apurinic or apyrimidinic site) lyase [Gammaproteobacteria bacterium]
MPELPEVETTRRGIALRLEGRRVAQVIVRERRLRWPISATLEERLTGAVIDAVERRGKYLLLRTRNGAVIAHLGMSGSMSFVAQDTAPTKHDHVDIRMESGDVLRFNDPRRFGCLLWTDNEPTKHPLLAKLGPEPLDDEFSGATLYAASRGRRVAIKPHIMNAGIVVGIGNIYASESLFRAGIHPKRAAGRIALPRMESLVDAIKTVLTEAIRLGGTTLRDFYNGEGKPGYFRAELKCYGRDGEPCVRCQAPIRQVVLGQRSTFYCVNCQT